MNSNDRFVRWQSVLRDHVSFLNNLLVTISIGVIGFLILMLNEKEFVPLCGQKVFFTSGFLLVFISSLCGLVTTIFRLIDFRTTLGKIKSEANKSSQTDLNDQKDAMKLYGAVTWFFLFSQVVTVTIGSLSLIIAFCSIYYDKLF